jgi:radical SAM superfamily enzyme YgiQ (UPF0313 family)
VLCDGVVRVRPHVTNVSFGLDQVYTFEKTGRLHSAFIRGHHYRRALDHRVLASWRIRPKGLSGMRERWVVGDEAVAMVDDIHRQVAQVGGPPWGATEHQAIDRIAGWTPGAYEADAEKFLNVYRPVSILPPDQYLSVMVQATEGCSWNRCTFCDFYQDQTFRIRPMAELNRHIEGVREFFGDGIGLRKSIFLGDGNALAAPFSALVNIFKSVQTGFPDNGVGPSWRETSSFVDIWGASRLSVKQIATLKEMGLCRVYLGLETGHDGLLAKVGKRGSAKMAIDVVRRFKEAGVSVGLMVMLGLGGHAFAQDHVWDTTKTLNQMGLGRDDLVYFSPLVGSSHLKYMQDMWASNIESLSDEEMASQYVEMLRGLQFGRTNKTKVALYNIKRFVY